MTLSAEALNEFIDRENVLDLVRRERFARDQRRFDVMADCFHENAWVRTSWYDGIGGQAYVDATRKVMGDHNFGKHWVFPAYARINGDRALVESPAKIFGRQEIGGVQVDVHTYCRFFSRAVRQSEQWKLLTFHVLWEHSEMRPVIPGEVPELDMELWNAQRRSYQVFGYANALRGFIVNPDLLGDDRWDELVEFHQHEDEWLAGKGAIDDPK